MNPELSIHSGNHRWIGKGTRRQFLCATAAATACAVAGRPAFTLAAASPGTASTRAFPSGTMEDALAGAPRGPWRRLFLDGAVLATLRLDGFCSMRAGARESWLITRREPFHQPALTINAKTASDLPEELDPNQPDLARFPKTGP